VYGQLLGLWQGKQLVLNTEHEFAITTNPSLHVALGMLCVYCAWRISLFFGIALAVYQSFNMLATVLLLQHYVIDVPFGLMVGVVGVLVARQALRYETEHMNVNAEVYFMVLETARRDIRKFCRLFVPRVWLKKNISAGDVIR
jgi:membrane-associated phospholipid phosphatase